MTIGISQHPNLNQNEPGSVQTHSNSIFRNRSIHTSTPKENELSVEIEVDLHVYLYGWHFLPNLSGDFPQGRYRDTPP
ncbi:hypothetical protein AX774_g3535 [Zancudomyces culisetae]|uniref:Uncharacterized protein n=1 Tax=Zancudomyces culisetae TaxID=1213189 RepID=A0A1R1PPS0_ZANCU|nr:hypothetical protein AX774_g3535 [Zancudomyces culisetae]|eukprot:OMH82964.1 hypothetical protein AX774_g3535 [Zancudomyces culisetae]